MSGRVGNLSGLLTKSTATSGSWLNTTRIRGSVLGEFDWSAWSSLRIGIYIHGRSAILNLDDWAECLVGQHEVEWFDHHGLEMLFDYDD